MASCSLFCNFYSLCSLLQLIKSQPSPACRFNRWTCIILGPFSIPLLLRSVAVLAFHQIAAGCSCSGPHAAIAENRRPPVAILGLSWVIFAWGRLECLGCFCFFWRPPAASQFHSPCSLLCRFKIQLSPACWSPQVMFFCLGAPRPRARRVEQIPLHTKELISCVRFSAKEMFLGAPRPRARAAQR